MQYAPTRVHENSAQFYTQTFVEGHFGAYALAPLHGYVQNLTGFIVPTHGYAKNAPDFTFPNKDTPKTRPILAPNLRCRTFRGVCFCAPTRVHAKPVRFHISAHGYVKKAPDFTLPNRDTPKTRPILGANPCRRTFSGRMQYAPTRVRVKFARF